MKTYFKFIFFSWILVSLILCDDPKTPIIDPGSGSINDFEVIKIIPNGDEKYLLEDAEYIFDHDKLFMFLHKYSHL